MATSPVTEFLQRFRRTALLRESDEQTDGQLLERFVRGREGVALEALVRRHAPMVWGVCRRALASHHEAEDAFQATFLVLLRKAASIHSRELLANWLYRVAHQTARKARQRAAKRFAREKQVEVMPKPPTEPHDDAFGPELRARLDDELGRLPEKYRIAVVLCDLEGWSRGEVAQQLRLAEGTVASRLARGRALLARRLTRRGLGALATSLAAVGSRQAASGAVPATLLTRTVEAAGLLAAGKTVAPGLISREVSLLTEAVLRTTGVAKKTAGALLVVAALVLAGGMVRYHTLAAPPTSPEAGRVASPEQLPTGREEVRRFAVGGTAWSVSFSPDGRQILIGTDLAQPVRVYDVSSGEQVRRFEYNGCWSAAFSHDGKFIVVGSGVRPTQILDAVTGQVRCQIEYNAGRVRNVTFSPDGRLVAASLADGWLRVLEFAQGKLQCAFRADNNAVHSAAFTPDGKCLLVIDPDNTLRLYEVGSTERQRFQGHTARVTDVAVSPDGGRALSCSADQTLRLWDLQTGKELRRLQVGDELPHGVAFCPDGRHAVSCGYDKTVRLWDLETGKELRRFGGHEGSVCCVAVSPDGRYALSGSWDQTVRLWRLPDPAPAPAR
jgi:RNA polymerase sigma factor (sigma-70 family)